MFDTSLSTVAVWALLTSDHTQVALRVLGGLALLAVVEILAGLWLMRSGGSRRRVRH